MLLSTFLARLFNSKTGHLSFENHDFPSEASLREVAGLGLIGLSEATNNLGAAGERTWLYAAYIIDEKRIELHKFINKLVEEKR